MEDERFREIEDFLRNYLRTSIDSQHDWGHADRVRKNGLKIANIVKIKGLDRNLLQVMCLVHDAHYTMFHHSRFLVYSFENFFAKRAVVRLLRRLPVTDAEAIVIVHAVARHAHSFPFKHLHTLQDAYTKILQDADTLDFFNIQRVKKFKKHFLFGRLFSPTVDYTIEYGREHIAEFLNFPEVAALVQEAPVNPASRGK